MMSDLKKLKTDFPKVEVVSGKLGKFVILEEELGIKKKKRLNPGEVEKLSSTPLDLSAFDIIEFDYPGSTKK